MVGWYHPYCSILRDLDYCAHIEADIEDERYQRGGLFEKVADVVGALPLVRDTKWRQQRNGDAGRASHEHEVVFLSRITRDALPAFHSGLMGVHLPIPHPPALHGTYFSNLIEADNALGEIRKVMESSGTWDGTTVFVTADHWWRTRTLDRQMPGFPWTGDELAYLSADQDQRVPFMVKLPGQRTSETYEHRFNTVVLGKLIRESLTGKAATKDEFRRLLDNHRNDALVHAYVHRAQH
jgi:arylsulfatase A-like enzyme